MRKWTKLSRFSSSKSSSGKKWVALWGNGDHGRLGLGTTSSFPQPMLCDALESHQPTSLACGGAHTLILTDEGRVFATGMNSHGQLGLPLSTAFSSEPVEVHGIADACVHVAAGYFHSAAVTVKGDAYLWGRNGESQLGLGKGLDPIFCQPQRLERLDGLRLTALALGSQHSLALAETGEVLSWGANSSGCLGHGQVSGYLSYFKDKTEYFPRIINGFKDKPIKRISTGIAHSACLSDDGVVFTFGQGKMSQLGLGEDSISLHPSPVEPLPRLVDVSCGGYHTGVITYHGDLYMWGSNEYGCLGSGNMYHQEARVPLPVEKLKQYHVSEVSCGWKHTAVIADGEIYTWGWGGSHGMSTGGQLGLGNEFDSLWPSKVDVEGYSPVKISSGFNHTGAILVEK